MSDSLNNPRNEDLNGRQEGFPQTPSHEGQGGFPNAPQGDMNHQGGFDTPVAGMVNAGGTPDNLDLPLYGASMGQAVTRFFKRYAKFQGRSSRSEYLWVQLALFIISAILMIPIFGSLAGSSSSSSGTSPLASVFMVILFLVSLAVLVPSIALSVRRLHDTNQSGYMYLLSLIPYLGGIIVFIMCCLPTKPEGARFDDANAPGVNSQFAGHNGSAY